MDFKRLTQKLHFLYSKDLAINVIGTILGGAALTFLLFFFGEVVFPAPNLTGDWRIVAVNTQSAYRPFLNVKEYFDVELLQKGCEIIGSGDVISEKDPKGDTITFKPEKRVKIDITGYLEHHYLTPNDVNINVIYYGALTKSTNTFILKMKDNDHLTGTYSSTASNIRGNVVFERRK